YHAGRLPVREIFYHIRTAFARGKFMTSFSLINEHREKITAGLAADLLSGTIADWLELSYNIYI
ncbi:MAG: hypothetical protein K1W08_12235, partial [Lachnospiraceae bacterium]